MAQTRAGSIAARLAGLLALALALALALGCSPKVVAGDASAGVDAVDAGVVDSLGDLDGGGGEGIADAVGDGDADAELGDSAEVGEIADAITDATSDVAEVDAAALPLDCTPGAMPAQADGFVLTDVGPLVPNKVVTGCGKGKPQPVAQPAECSCDCPPPYSCYCNGECAWLRTPDLNTPHDVGRAVWTGKWVVATTSVFVGYNEKTEAVFKVRTERWDPSSTQGFIKSKPPSPDFEAGLLRLYPFSGKVLITVEFGGSPLNGPGLTPFRPAHWYDPETDSYEPIKMPNCSGLVATATHLACCDGGFGGDQGAVHLYDVAAKSWSKFKAPAGLLPAGESICWDQFEELIADDGNLYFINPVSPSSSAVWPDGSKASDGGHVIRYDVAGAGWKDLGKVPLDLFLDHEFILRFGDSILFGFTPATPGMQLGQFDLATGKTKIVKSSIPFQSGRQAVAVDCGIFMATGDYDGPPGPTGQTNKYRVPAFVHADLSVELFPNWGYPSDDRGVTTALKTDKEILVLGGYNGGYEHKDGYRYPLSQVCKGAKP